MRHQAQPGRPHQNRAKRTQHNDCSRVAARLAADRVITRFISLPVAKGLEGHPAWYPMARP